MASLFPPRCFTCGKVIRWQPYADRLEAGKTPDASLDEMGMRRMCCRRMFLGHVPELEESMMLYPHKSKAADGKIDHSD